MIVKAIQTHLKNVAGITDLVSSRIYPHHLSRNSDNTYPLLTHQLISDNHLHVLGGAAGQATARIQMDCWGRKLSDVEILAEQVRQALQGFSGTMGTVTLDNDFDMHEAPKDASEKWLYRRTMDFLIKYVESIPA